MIFDNLLRDFGPRSLSHERGGRCAVKPRGPRGICFTENIRSDVMVARGLRNRPVSMTIAILTGHSAAEIIPHRPIRMQPKPSELQKCGRVAEAASSCRLRHTSVSGFPRSCLKIRMPCEPVTSALFKPDVRISRIRLARTPSAHGMHRLTLLGRGPSPFGLREVCIP